MGEIFFHLSAILFLLIPNRLFNILSLNQHYYVPHYSLDPR